MPRNQSGAASVLILVAAVGVIVFILISQSADFKDKLLSTLFPNKPKSYAVSENIQFVDDNGLAIKATTSPTVKVKLTEPIWPSASPQDLSSGPKDPTAATNSTAGKGNIDWQNPNGLFKDDIAYAYINSLAPGKLSANLVASKFDFSIPETAAIKGVLVEVKRKSLNGNGIIDKIIRIGTGKKNLISPDNKAKTEVWPNRESYISYGGPADKWGLNLTAQDINNQNFKVSLQVGNSGSSADRADINHLRITVYYTTAAGTVTTQSVTLAEDPNFTVNTKSVGVGTAAYTFSNSTPGTKTLYGKFISSLGTQQNANPFPATIELISPSLTSNLTFSKPVAINTMAYSASATQLIGLQYFIPFGFGSATQYESQAQSLESLKGDPKVTDYWLGFNSVSDLKTTLTDSASLEVQRLKAIPVSTLLYNLENTNTTDYPKRFDSVETNPIVEFARYAKGLGFKVIWVPLRGDADKYYSSYPSLLQQIYQAGVDGILLQEQQQIDNSCVADRIAALTNTFNQHSQAAGKNLIKVVQVMSSWCESGDIYAASNCPAEAPISYRFKHCDQFVSELEGLVTYLSIWAQSSTDTADLPSFIQPLRQ